jgi:competence protein ComEC
MIASLGAVIGLAAWRQHRVSLGKGLPSAGCWLLVAAILMIGLSAGHLLGSVRATSLLHSDLEARVGDTVEAELVVTGAVRSSNGWQSATAVVTGLSGAAKADPGVGEAVLLEVSPTRKEGPSGAPSLTQGAVVSFRGFIEAPRGPSDSGYDQARQLVHQGIKVVFRADGSRSLVVVGHRGGVSGWFDRLRASAREHLSQGPDPRIDEVLQGVVTGDTAGIDEDWLNAFRRSGTAHMLSVSGLHVASLAAIMIGLARLLRAPRWAGFLLAATSAMLIIPFVGASAPVIRSSVMIVIVLTGRWVGRGRDQWQVLALSAVAVLGLNPFAVFDVGFQLSFAAFLGMLLLLGPLQRMLRRLPTALGSNVAVSLAASAGTAPVALIVFGKTSLVSPLANLLVVPTLPLVTGLGMASVFLGFLWSGLSTALDALASIPMTWTVLVSRLMSVAPVLNTGDMGRAALAGVAGAGMLPITLALLGRLPVEPCGLRLPYFRRCTRWVRARRPQDHRLAAALAVLLVVCALAVGAVSYPVFAHGAETLRVAAGGRSWPDRVELRVLDVGQGNAVLLRTPERHAVLFDGGPAGCDLGGQLHSLGVDNLDLVIVSHPHADHFAGLLQELDDVQVDTLIDHVQVVPAAGAVTNGRAGSDGFSTATETGDYLDLRRRLAGDGCRYARASSGYDVRLDGVTVRFFAPADPLVLHDGPSPWGVGRQAPSGDELNAASLVVVVTVDGVDMLLPGDAEAETLKRYELPPTEVLLVPHHGSRGAVTAELLTQWSTEVAFVSVGRDNTFGHPHAGTIAVLRQALGYVVRTDSSGWVCCTVKGESMTISAEHMPTTDTDETTGP